jgi:hypothetical protein
MFENDMPTKREFSVLPKPEALVSLVFRAAKYLIMGGCLYFTAVWALSVYTGVWHWNLKSAVVSLFSPTTEAHAENPPRAEARPRAAAVVPVETEAQPQAQAKTAPAAAPAVDPERMDRLSEGICQSYGLVYDGQTCGKPPAYSAAGIRLRATHGELGHAVEKLFGRDDAAKPRELPRATDRMIDESEAPQQQQASETWRPQLRIPRLLHEPGEPCAGGGHRDRYGLGCVFTDEEREELRHGRW